MSIEQDIFNLIEITEAMLPMVKKTKPIVKPSLFKTTSQINKEASDNIKKMKASSRNTSMLRKEAVKNTIAKQNAMRKDPILRKLEAQREARLNKDGVKSNTVSV